MKIPKIIWAVWLDFNNKKDGDIDKNINFFINNIKIHHINNHWKINIITKWNDLICILNNNEDGKKIINFLDNKFIGGAHKSDLIRFYLLKYYGGIWIDITTFITRSFDYLLDNCTSFGCFYIPSSIVVPWIYKPIENLYEFSSVHDFNIIENKYILLKNKYYSFDFITENYFIYCTKDHPIIINLFEKLINFWNINIKNLTDNNSLCNILNEEIHKLFSKIFIINTVDDDVIKIMENKLSTSNKKLTRIQSVDSEKRNELLSKILKSSYDCGYLFGYLQLYLEVFEYCMVENNITQINRDKIKYIDDQYKDMCMNNSCDDITLTLNNNDKIFLISATRMRTGKWSDSRENRISWRKTLLGEKIYNFKNNKDIDDFFEFCNENKITQLKFSSFTRNSDVIKPLMEFIGDLQAKELKKIEDLEAQKDNDYFHLKYLKYKKKYHNLKYNKNI